jgi:nucleotide-binding universal stress UspA family protein
MQQILVPLDGSVYVEAVVPYAALLARTTRAAITLTNVVAPAVHLHPWPEPTPRSARQAWEHNACVQAHTYLGQIAQRIGPHIPLVRRDVLVAEDVAAKIVAQAQAPDVALIAMTTHGRGGLNQWMVGSVAHKVLQGASVPLLLVRGNDTPPSSAPEPALRTILVPLDGSPFAEQALTVARSLAQANRAGLLLLAAVPPVDDIGLALGGIKPLWALADNHALEEDAQAYLDRVAGQLRADGFEVCTHCVAARPADAIVSSGTAQQADLIVMTTHGRTGLRRLWLGSVAHKVVHTAHTPVLLVRGQPAAGEQAAPP